MTDMLPGFEKIVEERIREAQRRGEFNNLPGSGKPLEFADDSHVPEELRMAFKILKNADFLPPEIETQKEIRRTEDLLAGMTDVSEKYRTIKKLNFLIMKLNAFRSSHVEFDLPQLYVDKITGKMTLRSEGQLPRE
jgi:hypothetical protein